MSLDTTYGEILEEACDPIEEAFGEDEREACETLIVRLGEGEIGSDEFHESVKESIGKEGLEKMQNALSLFE